MSKPEPQHGSSSAEEIKATVWPETWTAPEPRYKTGVFAKYVKLVGSASEGAVTSGV